MPIPGGPRRLSVPLLAGTLNLPVGDLSSSMPPPGSTALPTLGSAVFGGPASFSPPGSLPNVYPGPSAIAGGRKPSRTWTIQVSARWAARSGSNSAMFACYGMSPRTVADVWRPPNPAAAVSPTEDTGRLSRRTSMSEDFSTSPGTEPDRGDPMMKKIINCQMLDF